LVPGIDVPFHSRVLRVGVAEFRNSLERVIPRDKDPDLIIGRYIPNLVPRPFSLDRDFIQEIRDLVPAEPLDEILADYDTWRSERPREMARTVFIELLAWQFASPVRWIETQDLLFTEEAAGGLPLCCSPPTPIPSRNPNLQPTMRDQLPTPAPSPTPHPRRRRCPADLSLMSPPPSLRRPPELRLVLRVRWSRPPPPARRRRALRARTTFRSTPPMPHWR
jgi:hypothetical protein